MSISDTFDNGLRLKQVIGALRIHQQRRILLADQPGAGKTAQALVALELGGLFERESCILITTTMTGCQLTWAGELSRRVESQYSVVVADLTDTQGRKTPLSVAKRDELLAAKFIEAQDAELPLIVLANFEMLRWKHTAAPKLATLWDIPFDAVVIDESHLVLPTMEDSAKALTQFWYGLERLLTVDDGIRLAMSGTPDRGKLWNRYGTWKFLFPTGHRSFWGWCQSEFVVTYVPRGFNPRTKQPYSVPEIGKLRDPDRWAMFDAQHMIRRTKAEMLEGLPEKQWASDGGVDLPMTVEQADAYADYMDEMEQLEKEYEEAGQANKASAMKLQFALRSRQMATCTWKFTKTYDADNVAHTNGKPVVAGVEHSNKLAWIAEWLEQRGYMAENYDASLGKVVLVSFFSEVLHWLQAELVALGVPSMIIDGAASAEQKLAAEAAFQRGDLRVVLLSGHMGVSINLDAADDLIFVDSIHDPDKMEQAEDRIHRASRNHQVTYWRLASLGTADIATLEVIDSRYRETRARYDGDRGVSFARRMLGLEEMVSA